MTVSSTRRVFCVVYFLRLTSPSLAPTTGCGCNPPKDKAIKRMSVRNMVDSAALRDVREASAYENYQLPKFHMKQQCESFSLSQAEEPQPPPHSLRGLCGTAPLTLTLTLALAHMRRPLL